MGKNREPGIIVLCKEKYYYNLRRIVKRAFALLHSLVWIISQQNNVILFGSEIRDEP